MTQENIYETPKKKYFSFTDASFVTGDSPVTHDIKAVLEQNGIDGYIVCDGGGNITINLSEDGTTFGQDITLKDTEILNLKGFSIDSIKVTWVTDSAYRIYVL